MTFFYPRLDGLRAFAVVAVMAYHWLHPELFGRQLPLGFLGVQLFFVLSGYLIGGVLLRAQEKNDIEGTSQVFTLRQFVIRRALRIFPAYFVFLLITAVVLGAPSPNAWLYPLYLGNFVMSTATEWPSYWSHTWTLAVEEQFYVFAPLLVLFPRRKALAVALPGVIVAVALFVLLAPASVEFRLVPPKAFYGLLVGLGLALLAERRSIAPKLVAAVAIVSSVASVIGFVFDVHDGRLLEFAAPLAFAAVVWWATGTSGVGRFLEWKPFLHLGAMAYGLYLWHMPVPYLWDFIGMPTPQSPWLAFGFYSVFTYVIARVSWLLIEQPLNAHKKAFPYHRPVVATEMLREATEMVREPQAISR